MILLAGKGDGKGQGALSQEKSIHMVRSQASHTATCLFTMSSESQGFLSIRWGLETDFCTCEL